MTDISIIVPTRKRPDSARQMLNSLARTVCRPERLEVVFVVDDDDVSYEGFVFAALPIRWVRVKAGLTMGGLNMAGYRISQGKHVMLLNDDVVVSTEGWDEIVLSAFRSFDDGIVLIHVNDHLFEEKLCTFPFLTRDMCERMNGICPESYRRYRIDDHIYNIFNLLSVLGHNRILYLPDVVFAHHNFVMTAAGGVEYQPDPAIHAIDTELFDSLLEDRKRIAVELAGHVDARRNRQMATVRANVLAPISDSVSLRRPEYVRTWRERFPPSSQADRVTVGVVTANVRSPHAEACIAAVKQFTSNYDLVVIDNNRGPNFNHSREMNRIIAACRTNYLVLMDDDVIVEAGWLDGMLRCIGPKTGIVTPLHKGASGTLSYAGVVMTPDHSGHHTHAFEVFDSGFPMQTMCSAIFLIDIGKCGHLRVDEAYSKYFLDIDYGLRVWESGYEAVCSPYAIVTHMGGATLTQGSALSNQLFEEQRLRFVRSWIETGRYAALESSAAWSEGGPIAAILDAPARLHRMLAPHGSDGRAQYLEEAHEFFEWLRLHPALLNWVRLQLQAIASQRLPDFRSVEHWQEAAILGQVGYPTLMEVNYGGRFNLILWNGRYYAMTPSEGAFNAGVAGSGGYSHLHQATRLHLLKVLIDADVRPFPSSSVVTIERLSVQSEPRLIEEGYRDYNIIVWNDRFYALAQSEGAFDALQMAGGTHPKYLDAQTVAELKSLVDARVVRAVPRRLAYRAFRKALRLALRARGFVEVSPSASRYPVLIEEGVRGVNIVRFGDWFYAVPQASCASVLNQSDLAPLRDLPRARKISLLRGLIDAASNAPDPADKRDRNSRRWVERSPVILLVENYREHSIYRYEFKYFAIPARASIFSYATLRQGGYASSLIAHSLPEVKRLIDRAGNNGVKDRRVLLFGCVGADKLLPYLDGLDPTRTDILWPQAFGPKPTGFTIVPADALDLVSWSRAVIGGGHESKVAELTARGYDSVVLPWNFPETWQDNTLEAVAAKISDYVEVLVAPGGKRGFHGENLHRLFYNKSYLCSMFAVVPQPSGRTVLEVGCGDGMVCEIFALLGASKVVGIDVMETVGCGHNHPTVEYHSMEAGALHFPDRSFDIVYSIATLEHVPNPAAVLHEIVRVLKPDGYAYVQAAPLYHSPFGHHMFDYFRDQPWIHLRRSKAEILAYVREHGIDERVRTDFGSTAESYLDEMLNFDHVNGLFLQQYGLDEFQRRSDIEVLKFARSYEGEDLLTPDILREVQPIGRDRLIEHGFEMAFRRRA